VLYCERNLVERFFKTLPGHRHALRQTRSKFSRRRPVGRSYHPAQLRTGPSLSRPTVQFECVLQCPVQSAIGPAIKSADRAVRDALIAFMAATAQAQAEATKSAQRAGIDHNRRAQPSAYLGRKPSYDRATFDRIRLALDSASPPSLSAIAKAEGLSKQTVFRLKHDPQAALAALDVWGL